MRFSYKELKRLASLPEKVTLEEVTKAINSIGFEVEGTFPFGDVEGVKFGKVIEVSKNPHGDKLNVCKIEFDDKTRIIQTTATNVVPGKVIIAFVPGSRAGNITFSEKKMKEIISEGMLSSLTELGVSKDLVRDSYQEGIMFYDEVKDLSLDPIDYLDLQDTIIDVDILSNRSDAQSYYVMARELAAYFKTDFKWPGKKQETFTSNLKVENGEAKTLAMLEASKAPKISIKEQILLAKYGLKSINDIVDLTNLTLIITGQPTHAYDKTKVDNNFSASKYTGNFKILGNEEVVLDNDLVISSGKTPVSIAGVIGGLNTGVSEATSDFILELGVFPINDVRKASKSAKVTNYSASQSSKIISKGTTNLGISFLTSKLESHSQVVNFNEPKPLKIKYDPKFTCQLSGYDITKEVKWNETINALEILGFKFLVGEVIIPTYRHDVKTIQDLNEEIFRFFGYDSFKPEKPKIASSNIANFRDYKTMIASQGYQEVTTYSLISKEKNVFNPFDFKETLSLETFVSKEREVVRSSQLVSILEVTQYNAKRNIKDISIFSEGMIGSGITSYILASTTKSFSELKQDVVNLLPRCIKFKKLESKELHPGVSALITLEDKVLGWIGKAHPALNESDAFVAELLLDEPQYISNTKEYDVEPLKSIDITFSLKEGESISKYIDNVNAYSIKIIDEFKKDDVNKVTISFKGNEKQIEKIDKGQGND